MYKVKIIIPIYYPDERFNRLLKQLKNIENEYISILIIDSGSDELYLSDIDNKNCYVKKIRPEEFDHGGTRQMAIDNSSDDDIYIFLTQDVNLFDKNTIIKILKIFSNENIGCAYGRQLPYANANIMSVFARTFNYKDKSYIRDIKDKNKYGLKTVFISNSFAAYRRTAMQNIGGFPSNVILSEDMYVAAKMLLSGWKIAYMADAKVYHSHNYTIWQEFKRYFDIGVFHAKEKWIRKSFGQAEGEGKKFILSEFRYILNRKPLCIFEMIIRDGMKFLGYRIGLNERFLNKKIKKKLSMNTKFWSE